MSGKRHSRDDVVVAALAVLDEFGLPDLTMRRLASTLDVQASALYWHFPNKQALLASVSDRIVARSLIEDPAEWRIATAAQAASLREALLAYRDGAEVVSSSLALGLGGGAALTSIRTAISLGGFDARLSDSAAAAVLHFVLGHVFHEQQRLQADSLGIVAEQLAISVEGVATDSGAFADGIALLLDGLQTRPRVDIAAARTRP